MFRYLKDTPIRTKLLIGYSSAFLLVIALAGLLVFDLARNGLSDSLTSEMRTANSTMKTMIEGAIDVAIETQMKRIADTQLSQVEFYWRQHRQGFLTAAEAKAKARDCLIAERIGRSGFTYCVDSEGIVKVHPEPSRIGTSLGDFCLVAGPGEPASGYFNHDRTDTADGSVHRRAVYYNYFAPWDWFVTAASRRAEFRELVDHEVFRQMVLEPRFGTDGFSFVLDSAGNYVFHPSQSGNALGTEDLDGFRFIEHICQRRAGQVTYRWHDTGRDKAVNQRAVFAYLPDTDWIIVSSHHEEGVRTAMHNLVRAVVGATAIGLLLFLFISARIGEFLIWRLRNLQNAFRDGAAGDYSVRLSTPHRDEIGELGDYFNTFMSQLEANHAFLKQEVHERRQAETKARQNEGRFRTFLNTAKEGCVELNAEAMVVDLNPEACRILDRPESELVGSGIFDLVPGLGGPKEARRLLRSDIPVEIDVRQSDGTEVHLLVSATGIADEDGRLDTVFAMATDITEQRRATSQLRLTQFTLDSASVPVFWIGPEARLLYVNEATSQALGYSRLELLGMTADELNPDFSEEKWSGIWEEVREEGCLSLETVFGTRDGGLIPVDLTLNHIRFNGNHYVCAFAMDISERKASAEQLLDLNEKLEERVEKRTAELRNTLKMVRGTQKRLVESQKMAALGGLVAGVAHEINTPVGISVTAASHLKDKTDDFLERYGEGRMSRADLETHLALNLETANIIMENLEKAAEQIASFKRVAVDQSSLEQRRFDLRGYIEEIMSSLRPRWKKTKHEVEITGDDELELDSYPGVFSQIISNLTMNTLLHGFEDIEAGRIEVNLRREEDEAVLRFTDDGVGIPAENLDKLFDPFFTTKRGQGGSGLGLHITYNLVNQKLGGTIECESTPSERTTFTIRVPLAKEPQHDKPRAEQPV